jgi:membrane fusion protein (multidrug efflux system)
VQQRQESERSASLEMILVDGSIYSYRGKFSFADRQVDIGTGALRIEGIFPNPGRVLRPGQFARVRAITRTVRGAVLVPQRAVQELQGSYRIAAVGPDNRVSIRPVNVGERVGSMWIIDQGVRPGERIIAEGFQRVAEGMTVTPTPFTEPKQTASAAQSSSN